MKKGIVISILVVATLVGAFMLLLNIKFIAQKQENGIVAISQSMQNVYSSVDKILTASGITVKNFGETKIKAIKEYVKQHENNPELIMKWVQENPQQIDSKVWENFQKQIEAQYTKFEMSQKEKISMSQAYNDFLNTTIKGHIAQFVWGYPRKETKNIMDTIIQTSSTQETFKTGIEVPKNFLE